MISTIAKVLFLPKRKRLLPWEK